MKQMILHFLSKEFLFSRFLTGEKTKTKYIGEETS